MAIIQCKSSGTATEFHKLMVLWLFTGTNEEDVLREEQPLRLHLQQRNWWIYHCTKYPYLFVWKTPQLALKSWYFKTTQGSGSCGQLDFGKWVTNGNNVLIFVIIWHEGACFRSMLSKQIVNGNAIDGDDDDDDDVQVWEMYWHDMSSRWPQSQFEGLIFDGKKRLSVWIIP